MSKIFRTQSDGAHSVGLLCFQSEWVVRLDSTSGLPTNRESCRQSRRLPKQAGVR